MPDEKYEKHMKRPRTDRLTEEIKDLFLINKYGNSFRKIKKMGSSVSANKDDTQALSHRLNMFTIKQNTNTAVTMRENLKNQDNFRNQTL